MCLLYNEQNGTVDGNGYVTFPTNLTGLTVTTATGESYAVREVHPHPLDQWVVLDCFLRYTNNTVDLAILKVDTISFSSNVYAATLANLHTPRSFYQEGASVNLVTFLSVNLTINQTNDQVDGQLLFGYRQVSRSLVPQSECASLQEANLSVHTNHTFLCVEDYQNVQENQYCSCLPLVVAPSCAGDLLLGIMSMPVSLSTCTPTIASDVASNIDWITSITPDIKQYSPTATQTTINFFVN